MTISVDAPKKHLTNHFFVLFCFDFKDFFDVDHFKSLYFICYNIASVLQRFGFLAARHVGP